MTHKWLTSVTHSGVTLNLTAFLKLPCKNKLILWVSLSQLKKVSLWLTKWLTNMTHSGVTLNLTARGWGARNANSKNGLVCYPTLHISKVTHIVTHSGVTLNLTARGRRARNANGKMVLFVILPFIYQKWLTKWLTRVTHSGVTLNLTTQGRRAHNANRKKNVLVCYFTLWEPKKAPNQLL